MSPDLSIIQRVITYPSSYDKEVVLEAIKGAVELGATSLLRRVVTYPSSYGSEAVKIAIQGSKSQQKSIKPPIKQIITKNKKKKVFISYKKEDEWFAIKLANYLESNHSDIIKVIIDTKKIYPGDSLPEQINEMLNEYDVSILVMTSNYFIKKGWAKEELESIINKRVREGKRFVPILLKPNSDIPPLFSKYVYVDYSKYYQNRDETEFEEKTQKLLSGIFRTPF